MLLPYCPATSLQKDFGGEKSIKSVGWQLLFFGLFFHCYVAEIVIFLHYLGSPLIFSLTVYVKLTVLPKHT